MFICRYEGVLPDMMPNHFRPLIHAFDFSNGAGRVLINPQSVLLNRAKIKKREFRLFFKIRVTYSL